jgi:hypothetical protein
LKEIFKIVLIILLWKKVAYAQKRIIKIDLKDLKDAKNKSVGL